MNCKLLRESVDELQGNKAVNDQVVKINVDIDAYLDASYIVGENERLRVYTEISKLSSLAEKERFVGLLQENYGKLPKPLENLIDLGLMKNIAKELSIC
ncbi:MAG: TRCF domain-containing protein, partial [Clostridia bacterium]